MSCFIIAEAGVNHNGSLDMAMQLVDVAADAGADAVKFQTFHAEEFIRPGARKAEYQQTETGDGDQISMIRPLQLTEQDHQRLKDRCQQRNIEFMSTPFDDRALELLLRVGLSRLKIASGELTNLPFLQRVAECGLPMIVSTGMASLDEVRAAVESISSIHYRTSDEPLGNKLSLMHCTSNYPTALVDVNLRAIRTLADAFSVPVGYSDHTRGVLIGPLAVAAGAEIIEKHFTLDRKLPGPDHKASLEPSELSRYVAEIRAATAAMGDGVKAPRPSELPIRDVARRSITLIKPVTKGNTITRDDVAFLRPGDGISPAQLDRVLACRAARDMDQWTTLSWDDLLP